MFRLKLNISPQISVNLIEVTLLKVVDLFIQGRNILYEQNLYKSKTKIYVILGSYYSCNNYNELNVYYQVDKNVLMFLTATFTPFKYSPKSYVHHC